MTKAAVISLFTEMTGLILWVQHLWGRHLTICYCNNFLKLKGPLPVVLTNGAYWRTVINPFAWSSIVIFYIYSTLCMHVPCAIWRDFVIWIKFPIYKAWFTQSYHAKYWVVNLSWLTIYLLLFGCLPDDSLWVFYWFLFLSNVSIIKRVTFVKASY